MPNDIVQHAYSELWFAESNLDQLKVLLMGERQPEPVEHLDPVRITSKDDSFVVVLNGDVLFDFNKSDLKRAADAPLEQAWNKIKSSPRLDLVFINGYTDSIGDEGYNIRLSERRAQSVAQWFFKRGYLPPPAMRPQGFGKAQPVAPNTTPNGRARNRRVEIFLRNR